MAKPLLLPARSQVALRTEIANQLRKLTPAGASQRRLAAFSPSVGLAKLQIEEMQRKFNEERQQILSQVKTPSLSPSRAVLRQTSQRLIRKGSRLPLQVSRAQRSCTRTAADTRHEALDSLIKVCVGALATPRKAEVSPRVPRAVERLQKECEQLTSYIGTKLKRRKLWKHPKFRVPRATEHQLTKFMKNNYGTR